MFAPALNAQAIAQGRIAAHQPVAVLFARADSIYKTLPGVDVWDRERDARRWPGGCPIVAHPPCRTWGRMRAFARGDLAEHALALLAVELVQHHGGVLEHPAESKLWPHCGLPFPGRAPDAFGGWCAQVQQCDFGHRAQKLTWLYVVGCHPDDLPAMPLVADPVGLIRPKQHRAHVPIVTKRERDATPAPFATWLVETARRCAR